MQNIRKLLSVFLVLVICITAAVSVSAAEPAAASSEPEDEGIIVYVAPNGDDENPGTLAEPVKTLEAARDLVRELKAESTEALPVTVYLRAGTYVLSETFALTAEDGGTEDAPVTYRAYQNEKVVISGSSPYSLGDFEPITGEMKDLLTTQAAKDNVLVADASDLGLDPIDVAPLYDGAAIGTPLMMLDDHSLNLTRYPNAVVGTDLIQATVTVGSSTGVTLNIDDDAFWSWSYNTEDFIYGGRYRHGYEQVYMNAARNATNKTVASTHNVTGGSTLGNKPTQVFNAFESMDEPGEWYYDATTDKLYIYPYADSNENSELYITESNIALITVTEADHVSFEGLTVTSANRGIVVTNSDYCVINNCELVSFQSRALYMTGVTYSGIKNSVIAYTHSTAVHVEGGDQVNLVSGHNFISNNSIHDLMMFYSRNIRGVTVRGVGMIVDHNDFYNIPDTALNFANPGNADGSNSIDTIIEYNTFHDCLRNSTDMAIVYGGRTVRSQGTIVRYNHFYNYGKDERGLGSTARAVYADDGGSGVTVYSNIFGPGASGISAGAMNNNCGHNNKFYNNLLIDVPQMIIVTANPSFHQWVTTAYAALNESLEGCWQNPVYTSRWPWLAEAYDVANNGSDTDYYIPIEASDNVLIFTDTACKNDYTNAANNGKYYQLNQSAQLDTHLVLDGNLVINKDGTIYDSTDSIDCEDTRDLFVNYENGDYRLVDSVLAMTDFENIDQSNIGLQTFTYDGAEYLPGGNTPVASNVAFAVEEAEVGDTVTVTYQLSGTAAGEGTLVEFYTADSEDEDFYLNWKLVANENRMDDSYSVTEECAGKWLKCKVTPVSSNGTMGAAVWSDAIYVEGESGGNEDEESGLTTVVLDTIIADTTNWKVGGNYDASRPTKVTTASFLNSNTGIKLTPAWLGGWGWYAGDTYQNTEFSFSYKQGDFRYKRNGYVGFTLEQPLEGTSASATTQPINSTGVVSADAADGIYVQFGHNTSNNSMITDEAAALAISQIDLVQVKNGVKTTLDSSVAEVALIADEEYNVTFALYDISETEARIVVTVDGEEIINYVTTDETLISAEGYFGMGISGQVILTLTKPTEPQPTAVALGTMIADTTNWKVGGNYDASRPAKVTAVGFLNSNSTIRLTPAWLGGWGWYAGDTYQNTEFSFTYKQGDFRYKRSGYVGFTLEQPLEGTSASATTQPINSTGVVLADAADGIYVQFGLNVSKSSAADAAAAAADSSQIDLVQVKNGTRTVLASSIGDVALIADQEYDVTFALYDISDIEARIVVTVGGEEIINYVTTDETLISAEGYFGMGISGQVLLHLK